MATDPTANVAPPALELRGLSRSYGQKPALDSVSLVVQPGEVFGYLGPNGAGKTTTIKVVTGLLQPHAGDALVGGWSVVTHPLEVKARVGYVPESGAVFEKFTPNEYLTLLGRLHKLTEAQIADALERWLPWFALQDHATRAISTLSKGMKQKVCWTAAMLHDPDVLVLDEPLNGLDVESVARAKDLMGELAASGRTVFYSSHLIDIVTRVCTRVALLHHGRIVSVGTVAEVTEAAGAESLEHALLALCRE